MQRIAIVFDNTLRPETTGGYCLRALQGLVQAGRLTAATHILPSDLTNADLSNVDAICFVDDGLDYVLPQMSIPTAWWAIDTHLSFERCLRRARQVDITFAAQKNGAERLRAAGIEKARWLPLAFVGNFFPGHRTELLQLLREQFPQSYIGQCDYRHMAEVYAASKIVFIVQVHCPGEQPHDVTAVDHVKRIRNRPDLRFEFHIHEQILPAIRRAGGDVAWTDLYVVHSGSDRTIAGRARKFRRDFHLLQLDLQTQPDHPFVLFNLGMTYADAGEHPQVVHHLQRCLEVSQPEESHLRKAYALLVGSLSQLGQLKEAIQTCHHGLQLFGGDKELLFRQAMLQHQTGQLHQAVETYHRLLGEATDRHFTSIDTGLTNYKARHNLALVYEDLGALDQACQTWNAILRFRSDYEPAILGVKRNSVGNRETPQAAIEHFQSC